MLKTIVNMYFLLILCPILMIEGIQTLSVDSQLGTSIEDCFERISIGEQLSNGAIYRNVTELTSRECEHICKQDKQCQVYDYGVGAKGNATCNLSMLDEKEIQTKTFLHRHPDYDVYVRRVLCEQGPPKPIQVLADDPIIPEIQGLQHKPVFRPDPEDRPLTADYVVNSDIGYKPRPTSFRPDASPAGPADFPPSYGSHKPQDIPYKPSRPNDKFGPNDNSKPIPSDTYGAPPDRFDELHFQGYVKPGPNPVNDFQYKPEVPQYQYFVRPNRKPQGDDYPKPAYEEGHPNGPLGPDNRPHRPNDNGYSYNNNYANNYGLQQNHNSAYVEIYDPPRPYVPIKDRPHQNNYPQGYLGYGTYSDHGNGPNHDRPYNDRPTYTQNIDEPGYGTQKPIDRPINTKGHPPNDFVNQGYGGNRPNYYGYGLQQENYNKPSGINDQTSYNQGSYNSNDQGPSGYGTRPLDDPYNHRPYKPNRPNAVQDMYPPQTAYGDQYPHDSNGYGGNKGHTGHNNPYNANNTPNHLNYDEYGSPGIHNNQNYGLYGHGVYVQNVKKPYFVIQNDNSGYKLHRRPGYGIDEPYSKPSYLKPKPENDYQFNPSHFYMKPSYVSYIPANYGETTQGTKKPINSRPTAAYGQQDYSQKPGYNNQKPVHNDQKPGYHYETGYGSQQPGYNDPKPVYNDPKPGYNNPKPGYNDPQPSYNDPKPGYNNPKPGYNDPKPGYNNPKPGYNDPQPGYNNPTPGYSHPTLDYSNPQPGYNNPTSGYNNPPPGYNDPKPIYNNPKPDYNDQVYNDQIDKPLVNYSDPDRPDIKPVYEYDVERPVKVPSYIARPGGDVVTSYPVVVNDPGDRPIYKDPELHHQSYKACFRRVLAGKRALRSFVSKVSSCDTLEDCRRECALEKRFHCESFNYRQSSSYHGKGLCELMTRPIESFDMNRDFVADRNYDFYEIDRNSLEPNCPESLRGPGLLHSGFLSSKPGKIEKEWDRQWDRNWPADRREQGRKKFGDQMFVPYQIGVPRASARSDDQEDWGQYGGYYGASYYKDKNDYDKSLSHWGLSLTHPMPYFKNFDYNALGKHFGSDFFSKKDRDYRKYLGYEIHKVQEKIGNDPGSWKRGRWNSSGILEQEPRSMQAIDEEYVDKYKQCYIQRRPGMSLSTGAIRRSLNVLGVNDCEAACFNEIDFKCVSYSFRYSRSRNMDNCFLSERPYRGLEVSADSGSDVYAMPQSGCMANRPWIESECFWHVRSDTAVSGGAVKATLTVTGLGACEAECIRAYSFFCRGFSFRFSSPTIGDDDLHNCILTSYPPTKLDGSTRVVSGHELYARGNYGRGCEPATYDDTKESGECYLQYDKAARLTPSAIRARVLVKTEQECGYACSEAPFKCLSFSFNNNAAPNSENCFLSEIRLFDLQRDVDYVHSKDDWLFAFDVFSASCWHNKQQVAKSSELPNPIFTTRVDITQPGTAPSSPSGPSGSSYSSETPTVPSGPSGPSYSYETTGPHISTTSFSSKETYLDHTPELPRPIHTHSPTAPDIRPTAPEILTTAPEGRPIQETRPYRPDPSSQEYGSNIRPDVNYGSGRPYRPTEHTVGYYPGSHRPTDPIPTGYGKPGIQTDRPSGPNLNPGETYYSSGLSQPINKPTYLDERNKMDYFGKWNMQTYPSSDRDITANPMHYLNTPAQPVNKPNRIEVPNRSEPYGKRPNQAHYQNGHRDITEMQVSWSDYTVSGLPCRAGTKCAQNQVSGHWACETDGGEIGSWDYCCIPTHRCGYSERFQKPWCFVGPRNDQWRPCSEKYYPYHNHNSPHPSQGPTGYGPGHKTDNQLTNRPWRDTYYSTNPAYTHNMEKHRGPYLSEADRKYWDDLYENGPKAYYDKHGNPLPGYTRVPTEQRPHLKYKENGQPQSGHWVPVGHRAPVGHGGPGYEDESANVPGLGAPRYWPVAYLHKSPPPNITYFRFNETKPVTEKQQTTTPNAIPEARNIDTDFEQKPNVLRATNETNLFESKNQKEEKIETPDKTNVTNTPYDITTKPYLNNTEEKSEKSKDITNTAEDFEPDKVDDYNDFDGTKGIDDKLGDFSKSIEVLDIEDAKNPKHTERKTVEAEERQIEALGRLLASRRGSKLILGRRSQMDYQAERLSVEDDLNFKKYPDRRGTVRRISKIEMERDNNADKSLEVSETSFVRPPRILNFTNNFETVLNGKVYFDASLREERDTNSTRRAKKFRRANIDTTTPTNTDSFGKKKRLLPYPVPNPIKRVKRVYKKRYNPDEVRRRLLERQKNFKNSSRV